jgi:hypothetical protein
MRRIAFLIVLPLLSACTISESSGGSRGAPPAAPPAYAPPPQPGVAPNGPLPAGLYDVSERVLFDTCRPSRNIPPRVTLLKRHVNGVARASIPVQRFGEFDKPNKRRMDTDIRGYQSSGMSHPKHCPGLQNTMKETMENVTDTGFDVRVEFEVADGWDCPNPRPQPVCQTSVVYQYRLASAACEARCDGTVPGMSDDDVPAGPVAVSCSCP